MNTAESSSVAALRELVALKDLLDSLNHAEATDDAAYDAGCDEYDRRAPLAWAAARAALSAAPDDEAFERGRQQGISQERALWELAEATQVDKEIEHLRASLLKIASLRTKSQAAEVARQYAREALITAPGDKTY